MIKVLHILTVFFKAKEFEKQILTAIYHDERNGICFRLTPLCCTLVVISSGEDQSMNSLIHFDE